LVEYTLRDLVRLGCVIRADTDSCDGASGFGF